MKWVNLQKERYKKRAKARRHRKKYINELKQQDDKGMVELMSIINSKGKNNGT